MAEPEPEEKAPEGEEKVEEKEEASEEAKKEEASEEAKKADDGPPPDPEVKAEGTLPCSTCEANCWTKGWWLPAETEGGERKTLCDDCFLIATNISGADRCLLGQVKIIPKKVKKPKAHKKGSKAKH